MVYSPFIIMYVDVMDMRKCGDELWMLAHMLCNPLEVVWIVIHYVVENNDIMLHMHLICCENDWIICIWYEECEDYGCGFLTWCDLV